MMINKCFRLKQKSSFTLAEMILVSAIIAILSLSLYRSLSVGVKVWERSRFFSSEEDIMIFLDKFSMDLRNAMDFSLFEFDGQSAKIRFTTIVSVPMGREGASEVQFYANQIGRVEYGIDPVKGSIYRRVANYGRAVKDEFGPARYLVPSVKQLRFQYLSRNMAGMTDRELEQKVLPAAVEVSVYYKDIHGSMQTATRLINLSLHL